MRPTEERDPTKLAFHPINPDEYNLPANLGSSQTARQFGFRPQYRDYRCGSCAANTTGRVLCDVQRSDGSTVYWCQCACEKKEPTIIIDGGGAVIAQMPHAMEFKSHAKWPSDLAALYDESARSFGAGAFTSAAMTCRKVLMATACKEGDDDGKKFVQYVDYIVTKVIVYQKARDSIDKIRDIGNDANHKVAFVAEADARKALEIVKYMLDTIYALPTA